MITTKLLIDTNINFSENNIRFLINNTLKTSRHKTISKNSKKCFQTKLTLFLKDNESNMIFWNISCK